MFLFCNINFYYINLFVNLNAEGDFQNFIKESVLRTRRDFQIQRMKKEITK